MSDDHDRSAFGHEAALERNTDELRKALEANTTLTRGIRDRLA